MRVTCLRHAVAVWVMLALPATSLQANPPDLIFDNTVETPVKSVPLKPTRFTLYDSRTITSIRTFHWNGGKGALPGSIALQGKNNRLIGPWEAVAVDDGQGLANAYWEVRPNIVLDAGTYTVLDSEPGSWARNPAQGDVGIVRIMGRMRGGRWGSPPRCRCRN